MGRLKIVRAFFRFRHGQLFQGFNTLDHWKLRFPMTGGIHRRNGP